MPIGRFKVLISLLSNLKTKNKILFIILLGFFSTSSIKSLFKNLKSNKSKEIGINKKKLKKLNFNILNL